MSIIKKRQIKNKHVLGSFEIVEQILFVVFCHLLAIFVVNIDVNNIGKHHGESRDKGANRNRQEDPFEPLFGADFMSGHNPGEARSDSNSGDVANPVVGIAHGRGLVDCTAVRHAACRAISLHTLLLGRPLTKRLIHCRVTHSRFLSASTYPFMINSSGA